jgi:hypothetical protein
MKLKNWFLIIVRSTTNFLAPSISHLWKRPNSLWYDSKIYVIVGIKGNERDVNEEKITNLDQQIELFLEEMKNVDIYDEVSFSSSFSFPRLTGIPFV